MNMATKCVDLFTEIFNHHALQDMSIILYFTGKNEFSEMIQNQSQSEFFNDYNGNDYYDESIRFVQEMFQNANTNDDRLIFTHVMDTIDIVDVDYKQKFYSDFQTIVINNSLARAGLLN